MEGKTIKDLSLADLFAIMNEFDNAPNYNSKIPQKLYYEVVDEIELRIKELNK